MVPTAASETSSTPQLFISFNYFSYLFLAFLSDDA